MAAPENGNGNGNGRRSLAERLVAGATPTLIIAVASQLFLTVWWARGESARITANQDAVTIIKDEIYNMRTPLSLRVLRLEDQILATSRADDLRHQALQATDTALAVRIDTIDARGTRGSDVMARDLTRLEEQQQRILQTLDANYNLINEHIRSHSPDRPRK